MSRSKPNVVWNGLVCRIKTYDEGNKIQRACKPYGYWNYHQSPALTDAPVTCMRCIAEEGDS